MKTSRFFLLENCDCLILAARLKPFLLEVKRWSRKKETSRRVHLRTIKNHSPACGEEVLPACVSMTLRHQRAMSSLTRPPAPTRTALDQLPMRILSKPCSWPATTDGPLRAPLTPPTELCGLITKPGLVSS